ncbi:hypothetical protein NL676_028404 [Syzygium grande]|nr:hypothetical protein NL676_028404 [Syzygium grande]
MAAQTHCHPLEQSLSVSLQPRSMAIEGTHPIHERGPLPPTSGVRLLAPTPTSPPASDGLASASALASDTSDEGGSPLPTSDVRRLPRARSTISDKRGEDPIRTVCWDVIPGLPRDPPLPSICIDLNRDGSLSSKSIVLQIDNKSQQVSASDLRHSLQDRLSKGASGRGRDEIYLKLRTSTAPPLKLIDLPGLDQRVMDDSVVHMSFFEGKLTLWLFVLTLSFLIPLFLHFQISEGFKVSLSCPGRVGEAWRAMVNSPEGTRALALESRREFEDKFLQHITSGEDSEEEWFFRVLLLLGSFARGVDSHLADTNTASDEQGSLLPTICLDALL